MKRKLAAPDLTLTVFLLFCLGLYARFNQAPPPVSAQAQESTLTERIASIAILDQNLSKEWREQLKRIVLELEENPWAQKVIEGQAIPARSETKLTENYRALAQFQDGGSSEKIDRLLQRAQQDKKRFSVTAISVFFLLATAFFSLFFRPEKSREIAAPAELAPLQVLGAFWAWDILSMTGTILFSAFVSRYFSPFQMVFLSQAFIYFALVIVCWRTGIGQKIGASLRKFSIAWLGRGYFFCILAVIAIQGTIAVLIGPPPESENPILQLFQGASVAELLLLGVLVVFVGPIFEEVLFRAWLYGGLKDRWGKGWAIFISSALFALIHGDAPGLPVLFALGAIFAWVYQRSGSLWASIIVHGYWNATTFALLIATLA